MEISLDQTARPFLIKSYSPLNLFINDTHYKISVILTPTQLIPWMPQNIAELRLSDLEDLLQYQPSIVLIGTGEHHLPIPTQQLNIFYQNRIGVETMSTKAACRTYNVLMSEKRNAVAALLIH